MTREEAIAILNHKVSACLHGTEWGEALEMAIKALEHEPCSDAVSRRSVLDLAKKGVLVSNGNYNSVCKAVNRLPPVNPQPKTGEWQQDLDGTYLCSECGSGFKEQPTLMGKPMFLWCPLCGARMVEPQESEDT